jgi:glycosyltransferase involved in cell wall biosynthesis
MHNEATSESGSAPDFKVSVVVPCYNAETTLSDTLSAIASQQWDEPWEVVVADNRSTDGSRRIAESFRDRIAHLRIISANEGQGTPFAINGGVREARGQSVIFCDADDVPAAGWLAAMGGALDQYEFVACRMDVSSLNPVDQFGERTGGQTSGLMQISYPPYLPHAGGSTLGIRRQVFIELGGYDPVFVYLHETDFCFRVQLAGHELHFVPDAVLAVRLRRGRASTFKQAFRWAEYNILLSKRYKAFGPPPKQRWIRLWRDTVRAATRLPRWRRSSQVEQIRTLWQLGSQLGKIKGVIKYLAAPY